LNTLGKPLKITEMAHKPYPAGRATQATLTMIREIQQLHTFSVEQIKHIHIYIPPLVLLLVGRPPNTDMSPSYARLCLRFVAPLLLIDGDIDPRRYSAEAFSEKTINDLGAKITLHHDGNTDRNALGPQKMEIVLNDGTTHRANCKDPLGSPENPLSKEQRENKVKRCFALGLPDADPNKLIKASQQLADLADCSVLLDCVSGQ
jgi:2-methylcitrate dehydratase PrpD